MIRGALREVCDTETSRSARPCGAWAAPGFLSALRPARGRPRRASSGPPQAHPTAGEHRRVLVPFSEDIGRILEVRPPSRGRAAVDRGSHHDQRDDAAPVPETLGRPRAEPEEVPGAGSEADERRLGPERRLRARPGLLVCRVLPVVLCLARDRAGTRTTNPDIRACLTSKSAGLGPRASFKLMPALATMAGPFVASKFATLWTWTCRLSRSPSTARTAAASVAAVPASRVKAATCAASAAAMWTTSLASAGSGSGK
jgi:hypothetical protein